MKNRFVLGLTVFCLFSTFAAATPQMPAQAVTEELSSAAVAQQTPEQAVFAGLVSTSALGNSAAGRAALAGNLTVTGAIQNGTMKQPALLNFASQQQQALRDAFSTYSNLTQLADGLGTALGAAYQARATQTDPSHFTAISPAVTTVIAYANHTSGMHSNAAKYFFANATTNGNTPISATSKAILTQAAGTTDVFGKAYKFPAGSAGAGQFGNARPFQTEPSFTRFSCLDYFGKASSNTSYTRGPGMDLRNSPSFPSGHTTYGYTSAVLLAILVPERYPQMIVRGAEYGNNRIVVGAHYAMDVLGGRTLALYDMAHLLANDPAYVKTAPSGMQPIEDFPAAVKKARSDVDATLTAGCGKTVAECARIDTGRFSNAARDKDFYASTLTYSLPVVFPQNAGKLEDVAKLAPEAGYLLTAAFPKLTLIEADRILTETEGPGGGFLDSGSAFGVYSRLDLYTAGVRATELSASK